MDHIIQESYLFLETYLRAGEFCLYASAAVHNQSCPGQEVHVFTGYQGGVLHWLKMLAQVSGSDVRVKKPDI